MTGSVANSLHARAHIPPSGSGMNALDAALEAIMLSDISSAVVNGSSTVLDSAASAVPSATGSQNVSESASAISAAQSSASATISAISSSPVSAVSGSAESFTPAASASASESAAPRPAPAPAGPSSASSPDRAQTVPRNAAVPSAPSSSAFPASSPSVSAAAPSPTPSASSPDASTENSATFRTNPTASTPSSASSSSAPDLTASTPIPSPTAAPEPTTPETSTTEAAAPSEAPPISSTAVSTQNGAQSSSAKASATSGANNQPPAPSSSNGAASAAPQPSNSPNSAGDQEQISPSNASLRSSQPSATAASSPGSQSNLGNGFIGVSSSVHVDSTLPIPQAVTITSGSSTFTTTPAFITSISVSNGKNGSPPQTFTSIFANPTTVPQSASLGESSFWDNKGVVAGVFIAVALVILSSILGTFYCCRRRRRRMAGGFSTNTQFHRFSGAQDMSQQPTTYQAIRPRRFASDDPRRFLMSPSITSGPSNGYEDPSNMQRTVSQASHISNDMQQTGALGLTGILTGPPGLMQNYHGPFSDYYRYISTGDTRLSAPPGEPVGIAVSSDFEKPPNPEREAQPAAAAERRSPSLAPSSPSIYPPSLPPVPEKDEDDYLFYERETRRRPESQLPTPPPRAVVNDADSRNPFSSPLDPLYDTALKQNTQPSRIVTNQSYRPLTPPDSSSSSSPTTPQFPGLAEPTKPLNISPFSNTFLGRSVSLRTEPLPRPARSPLRLSASGTSLQNKEVP